MNNATKEVASTFGAVAALAGIEHGIGELLQGHVAPAGVMILSWPDSPLFAILAGEPAMTLLPSLFVSGVLTILFTLLFLVWATVLVDREHAGLALILLSIIMLLVGGGFGPPLLGIIVGLVATRIHAPLAWWRAHLSAPSQHLIAILWPWSLAVCLIAWLLLCPGMLVLAWLFQIDSPIVVPIIFLIAFGLLILTIVAAFARDIQRQPHPRHTLLAAR